MNDLSFIRLETTLQKALYTRNSPLTRLVYNGNIRLSPNESYLQTTNTNDGISFDGNYSVKICDCQGLELLDITPNVAIQQFTDANGVPQIRFEIVNIGKDFYNKDVIFKFDHTVSNYVWYSNPLYITDYQIDNTTRFDYKIGTYTNSIRLACYFDLNDAESSSEEYTTIDGIKTTSRLIRTEFEKYKFEKLDNFTFRRLNYILSTNVVYVNGYRMTNKVVSSSSERAGSTNVFKLDFKIAIDYNETFSYNYQIFLPFRLSLYSPKDSISLSQTPTTINLTFNRNLTLGNDGNLLIYKGNTLIATKTTGSITLNSISIPLSEITTNGSYTFVVQNGFLKSVLNEDFDFNWSLEVQGAQYNNTEYSNNYLI